MALELVYEGMVAGTKNVSSTDLSTNAIVSGRICVLTGAPVGGVKLASLLATRDKPFGLIADDKEDVVASGKVSVYFTPGLYKTDQHNGPAKGALLTFDTDGTLKAVGSSTEYVVGMCTEAAGSDGMIEMALNITGLTV